MYELFFHLGDLLKIWRRKLRGSELKAEPIVTSLLAFSSAQRRLHIRSLRCNWLI